LIKPKQPTGVVALNEGASGAKIGGNFLNFRRKFIIPQPTYWALAQFRFVNGL